MVTRDGNPVPPPSDELLDAALWRVRDAVSRQISTETTTRTSRRRRWIGALGGVVLFGAGIAVGGAALPALTNATAVFQVQCFQHVGSLTNIATVEFDSEVHAAPARQDPAAVCRNVQVESEQQDGIDAIVTPLVDAGHDCGTVTTDDGQTWRFRAVDGGLAITDGQFDEPLGLDCVTVHVTHVSPPTVQKFGGVACAVSAAQANVYPGEQADATAICRAQGYSVYSSTTSG